MKLWQKENTKKTSEKIEKFTVGRDQELDLELAPFDVLGNMAHAIMLESIGSLQALGLRNFNPSVTACPGCGRTTSETFQVLAKRIDGDCPGSRPG